MVRHLRGSLRDADGPVAAESQRPAHVVVTARFSREYIETDRRPAPSRPAYPPLRRPGEGGATDSKGEVRKQNGSGGRGGASRAGIGRQALVVLRSSHEALSAPPAHLLTPTATRKRTRLTSSPQI